MSVGREQRQGCRDEDLVPEIATPHPPRCLAPEEYFLGDTPPVQRNRSGEPPVRAVMPGHDPIAQLSGAIELSSSQLLGILGDLAREPLNRIPVRARRVSPAARAALGDVRQVTKRSRRRRRRIHAQPNRSTVRENRVQRAGAARGRFAADTAVEASLAFVERRVARHLSAPSG